MKKYINVATGEVKTGKYDDILTSHAIGSCVVITTYSANKRIGGMAHIMLPGKSPESDDELNTKYAIDAIETLLKMLQHYGVSIDELEISLIGGGNVLNSIDDTICRNNIESVYSVLRDYGLKVMAASLGGICRRTAQLEVSTGDIYYTEGDSKLKKLEIMRGQTHE